MCRGEARPGLPHLQGIDGFTLKVSSNDHCYSKFRDGGQCLDAELPQLLLRPHEITEKWPVFVGDELFEERQGVCRGMSHPLLLWQPWPLRCCRSLISVFNTHPLSHADLIRGTSDKPNSWIGTDSWIAIRLEEKKRKKKKKREKNQRLLPLIKSCQNRNCN